MDNEEIDSIVDDLTEKTVRFLVDQISGDGPYTTEGLALFHVVASRLVMANEGFEKVAELGVETTFFLSRKIAKGGLDSAEDTKLFHNTVSEVLVASAATLEEKYEVPREVSLARIMRFAKGENHET